MEEIWTPTKLVQWISDTMQNKGFPEPVRPQAEKLVCHALGISRLDIYLQYDKPTTPDELAVLRDLVKRRLNHEPLAYILGEADFWTLSLKVGPETLVPRPETEILIETVCDLVEDLKNQGTIRILEFGTGSGAIPISLATEKSDLTIVSVDINPKTMVYARENLAVYQKQILQKNNTVHFILSDQFSALKAGCQFDILVSNPPYIKTADIDGLAEEVFRWEPREALDGGLDGLSVIEYLAESSTDFLNSGGYLALEHGYDQKAPIVDRLHQSGELSLFLARQDHGQHDRVLVFKKK